jgi:CRP-like cAMP-binding protein
MTPKDLAFFSNNPIFNVLSESKLEAVIQAASAHKYKKGQIISNAGDIWPYFFLVKSGAVQALKRSLEGRSLVVTTFVRGDIFWGLAFFYEFMQMPVALEASEDSTIYLWSADGLHPFLKENGNFSWELSRLMIYKMARASEILEDMAFQPVAGRLAKLLMETGQELNKGYIYRSLTLDEMAARIGSTREMVCRFLHRFADDKIIDITRTEYRIVDQDRLNELVKRNIDLNPKN